MDVRKFADQGYWDQVKRQLLNRVKERKTSFNSLFERRWETLGGFSGKVIQIRKDWRARW